MARTETRFFFYSRSQDRVLSNPGRRIQILHSVRREADEKTDYDISDRLRLRYITLGFLLLKRRNRDSC